MKSLKKSWTYLKTKTMSKIIRKYETEDTISIWTYDIGKFKNGPVSVETIDKRPEPVKKKRKWK